MASRIWAFYRWIFWLSSGRLDFTHKKLTYILYRVVHRKCDLSRSTSTYLVVDAAEWKLSSKTHFITICLSLARLALIFLFSPSSARCESVRFCNRFCSGKGRRLGSRNRHIGRRFVCSYIQTKGRSDKVIKRAAKKCLQSTKTISYGHMYVQMHINSNFRKCFYLLFIH